MTLYDLGAIHSYSRGILHFLGTYHRIIASIKLFLTNSSCSYRFNLVASRIPQHMELRIDMKIKSNGNLKQLQKNLEKISETTQVTLVELMPSQFISNCSRFNSLEELFEASGFKIDSPEDFAAIPDDEWDIFIKENTTYEDWSEMQQAAAAVYFKSALHKGMR